MMIKGNKESSEEEKRKKAKKVKGNLIEKGKCKERMSEMIV